MFALYNATSALDTQAAHETRFVLQVRKFFFPTRKYTAKAQMQTLAVKLEVTDVYATLLLLLRGIQYILLY